MSTLIVDYFGVHDLTLTQYWGGDEKGICVQVTGLTREGAQYVDLTVDEAVGGGVDARKIEFGVRCAEQVEAAQLGRELTWKAAFPGPLFDVGEHPLVDPVTHGIAGHALLVIEHFVHVKQIESIEFVH